MKGPVFQLSWLCIVLLLVLTAQVEAQQPFYTDDADVTPRRHFHFQFHNEFDVLARSAFPNLKQNTADFELDYGLFENVEIGIEAPFLTIINDHGELQRRVSGIGDTNLSMKYNFLREKERSRLPAMAITFNLELPTGSVSRQLGSGLADFYLNGVLQKSLTSRTTLRLNGGILFSGNETTGVVGIKARGTVFTGGASVVRQFTKRLDLGVELVGAETTTFSLGKGQLQTQVGGNFAFLNNATLDFGIVAGKYVASPRIGAQLGVSIEF
jgi:hypothetical protein